MSRISVDAGHGGRDPGAVGPTGLREANINLEVCRQLATLLRANNYQVQMIRDSDVFVEIGERARQANNWHANYFVSIHCNSDGASANGIETLYRTNAGKELADPVQVALIAATKETNRGLKLRTDLGVLNGTRMPAILVEIGFISHKPTEDKFRQPTYLNTVAQAIRAGIVEFLGDSIITAPPITPPLPGKPRVDVRISGVTLVDIFVNDKPL